MNKKSPLILPAFVATITQTISAATLAVADWLAGELPRTEAVELAGVSDQEFALAVYVETHEPIEGAMEAVEGALALNGDDSAANREALDETMSDVSELR